MGGLSPAPMLCIYYLDVGEERSLVSSVTASSGYTLQIDTDPERDTREEASHDSYQVTLYLNSQLFLKGLRAENN